MLRDCSIYVGKTKALISCAVTAQLSAPLFSHIHTTGFLMKQLISVMKSLSLLFVKPKGLFVYIN